MIYLVRINRASVNVCVARGLLGNRKTSQGPWPDADKYKFVFEVPEWEFCRPFELKFLNQTAPSNNHGVYLRVPNPFNKESENAIKKEFERNKADKYSESNQNQVEIKTLKKEVDDTNSPSINSNKAKQSAQKYSISDIINDGCFLPEERLQDIMSRLKTKKNIILQGPPGTGKTWLAKKLGFALIGSEERSKLRAVQFHPNLSYEDFVRGLRPTSEGKLEITDGLFLKVVKDAIKNKDAKFVIVIEEINRGNPVQILGELLTLLEVEKRNPSDALELCYPDSDGESQPIYIPENFYVIGTMNVADRSIALVDLALRRRFAFINLEPIFGPVWKKWIVNKCGFKSDFADKIEGKITDLNETISHDRRLGKQFRIGHSYVTPSSSFKVDNAKKWFQEIVDTEIKPLLFDEYWFDEHEKAEKAVNQLLQGLDDTSH
jgi:MoxR-like ATPase